MKPHFAGIVTLAVLASAGMLLFGQTPKPDKNRGEPVRVDYTKLETPRKPLPKWIAADKDGKQVLVDQGQFEPRLKGYWTPAGLKVEIVADAPTVVKPVGMTFGDDGTLYVLEWLPGPETEVAEEFKYKDGTTRKVLTTKKSVKDVVKVLRDTKGTGVYDEAKVLLEEELPSSILVHDGWLYLSGRGTVRRYKLSELPAKPQTAPKAEVIAQGFCGNHHRQVSGLTIGNDGWLYITTGDDDNYAEGSDGSRATLLRTGGVFRCRPDGSKLHVFARGFRNPYRDLAFDSSFNAFHLDNDAVTEGKFAGCRLMHVAEEGDFGWRLLTGTHDSEPDPLRGAVWGEVPGKLVPLAKTGRGGPAGLLIYNDSYFPATYRGSLYYPDVVRKDIRAFQLGQNGATFEVISEFEFLKSDDPLFRPCQLATGPDGAMYVCDWRTDLAARQPASDAKQGRIYRITWAGTKDEPALARRDSESWSKLAKLPVEELLKTLSSPNFSDRLKAQQLLAKKGAEVRNSLLDLIEEPKQPLLARIAAIGALNSLWNDEVRNVFLSLLYAGEPEIRRLVAEGLALNCKPGDADADATLLQVLGDQDFATRRAIILAMGRIGGPSAPDALVNTFKAYKENEPYLFDAILRAIERLDKRGIERLVAVAQSGVEKDFDRVVEAFLALRVQAAAEAIPELLNYPHLTIPQRVSLIKSYSNYLVEPAISLAPVVKYLETHKDEPAQVKLAALEVLTMPGQPKNDKLEAMALPLLDQTDEAFRLGVIRVVEQGRFAKAAPVLGKLLTDAERPAEERTAAARALGVLGDKTVVPTLKELATAKPAAGAEALRLAALRSLAALDAGLGQAAAHQLLSDADQAVQTEAVQVLGAQPEGAKFAGEALLAKKLPRELLPQVAAVLRKHADKHPDVAKLLAEVQKLK